MEHPTFSSHSGTQDDRAAASPNGDGSVPEEDRAMACVTQATKCFSQFYHNSLAIRKTKGQEGSSSVSKTRRLSTTPGATYAGTPELPVTPGATYAQMPVRRIAQSAETFSSTVSSKVAELAVSCVILPHLTTVIRVSSQMKVMGSH